VRAAGDLDDLVDRRPGVRARVRAATAKIERFAVDQDERGVTARGRDCLDARTGSPGLREQIQADDGLARERHRVQREHVVRAELAHPGPPGGVRDELDPRAPAEPATLVVARSRRDGDLAVHVREPAELLGDHGGLPGALRGQGNVRELTTTHSPGACRGPRRSDAIRRRHENLDGVGTPERRALAGLGEPCEHPFARQGVPHEDDATAAGAVRTGGPVIDRIQACHAVPTVRDRADLELNQVRVHAEPYPGHDPRAPSARRWTRAATARRRRRHPG
jgi:hypothetical protein